MSLPYDRRELLKLSAMAGGSLFLPACGAVGRSYAANERLDVAVIGVGGKGRRDAQGVAEENLVALCDVDDKYAAASYKKYPGARQYRDYRVMLEQEKLDAVVVTTPDHSHAPAAVMAMELGLHVYCQKPLTHTVAEARVLRDLAARQGVVTSMGNQGTAMDGFRSAVEVVQSGAIGAVREVHVWTNRPGGYWTQGLTRTAEVEVIPPTMRWDLWLGPAPYRPYHSRYAPFRWRGFWDFGTGALGDMGCHLMNMPYMALQLGAPVKISAESAGNTEESAPLWSIVTYEFPRRGNLPAVTLKWYDGGKKPPTQLLPDIKMANGGLILVGENGTIYSKDDYGRSIQFIAPDDRFADYEPPAPVLVRARGKNDQDKIYNEWIDACKGGPPCLADFDYAGPLTETVLLGNVAIRTGAEITWDAERMEATGHPDASDYLTKEYAYGFGID